MKIINILSTCVFFVLLTSCEDGKIKYLKEQLDILNTQLPCNGGVGGDLISVKYNEEAKVVSMYWVVSNEMFEMMFQKSNQSKIRNQFRLSLENGKDNEFIQSIDKAGVGLTVSYKSSISGKSTSVSITHEELHAMIENPISKQEANKFFLDNMVELQNSACPQKTQDGEVLAKVALVNNHVVYYYQLDEDYASISLLKANLKELKRNLDDYIKASWKDPGLGQALQVIVNNNVGYQFRYFGSKTNHYVDVMYSPQELMELKR